MVVATISAAKAMKVLNNLVKYSDGFIKESKAQKKTVADRLAKMSIAAFYEYVDGLSKIHPDMLHHVYEWYQIGSPSARLFELKKIMAGGKVEIISSFLQSRSIQTTRGTEVPFYDKARVMEEGVPLYINERDADILHFFIGGTEFFRHGPIYVEHPGGEATKGAYEDIFNEFYGSYLQKVYLKSIGYYDHLKTANAFAKNFKRGVKSGNAESVGRRTAYAWLLSTPGISDFSINE